MTPAMRQFDRRAARRHGLPRYRSLGAWLFMVLLLAASAERRLADAHFNLQTAGLAFGNSDLLDADEIKVRLLLNTDSVIPVPPLLGSPLVVSVLRHPAAVLALRDGDLPSPRAPPERLSAIRSAKP